ncbi:MAG: NAD-dependent epimerase/dehydratase family protein [Bacteroidales bacterium]|nr:NAD-dependent epimerase/dehydratase family protein [Bacteroidales bacterium]
MFKVGITGQAGFIGTHLYNYLNLKKDEIITVPFEDAYFADEDKLNEFVNECDVIVHLAAMNRHNDPNVIYDTNIELCAKLVRSLELTGKKKVHVLFSSSIQEEKDNLYGVSKRECRIRFEEWAKRTGSYFTGLIIPNVFGPFGRPFYNSVIATFCYQLTHGQKPEIHIDASLQLIYVMELAELIYRDIIAKPAGPSIHSYKVPCTSEVMVSEILGVLQGYRDTYLQKHTFPSLKNKFEQNLFNTFRSYIDHSAHYPVKLIMNTDQRGCFVETIKTGMGGQFSFSTTLPGITRGNHFHIRKIERFAVIKGKAVIELRQVGTNKILKFELDGEIPSFVDMPVWFTHNITNTGEEQLITLFWINEFFDPDDPDTFFEKV